MIDKKTLRAQMRDAEESFLLSGLSSAESARILSSLESDPAFVEASCVLMYMSMPGEVETHEFIRKWSREKTIAIPQVCGDSLVLFAYHPDRLTVGYKGILEPSFDADPVDVADVELAVIPGVAFACEEDRRIVRMGRGKGFYDRLLPRLNCPVYGVAFPFRKVDEVPYDSWDRFLDKLFV